MNRLYRLVSKAPNYLRRFGLAAGAGLLVSVERPLPERSSRVRSYRVPGLLGEIRLRECTSDHAIFWQCLVRTQYDTRRFPQHERLMLAYREAIERGERPLIIDCGANIGLASVWFANAFPEARICAIEPDPANFSLLQQNVAAFGERVMPLQGGVWNESARLRISNPHAGSAAFRVEAVAESEAGALRTYTIPELCALAGVAAPLIVKIDIEGAQLQLFQSNTEWVGRTPLIALELDDWLFPWKGTSRPFFSCVSRYPFDYLISGETIFCFLDARAAESA